MIQIQTIPFGGWPNCRRVSNSIIDFIATTDVGPRIISFGFTGQENLFYQDPTQAGATGGSEWRLYGGHRLWHAPEVAGRTYFPDNGPVAVEQLADGIILTAPVEPNTGIQKIIELRMDPAQPKVYLRHVFINHNLWAVPLAPWAISVMRAGGVAVFPHPARKNHEDALQASHSLALWSYTRMSDPRWTWGDDFTLLRQDPAKSDPQKGGLLCSAGWGAYVCNGAAFIKYFDFQPGAQYPDQNSNLQAYTNDQLLEVESLGPLTLLGAGETLEHRETWALARGVDTPAGDADVHRSLLPWVEKLQ